MKSKKLIISLAVLAVLLAAVLVAGKRAGKETGNGTPTMAPTTTVPTDSPHEHEWVTKEIPATCTTIGMSVEECACGALQNKVETEALNHPQTDKRVTRPATEEAEGNYLIICFACGQVIEQGTIPKLGQEGTPAPEETQTPEPTAEPTVQPTAAPTATAVPKPTAASTPTPKPSAVPTTPPAATQKPTPNVDTDEKPVLRFQMGDNVWYDVYEDMTLVVYGTGATWDFEDYLGIVNAFEKAGDFKEENGAYKYMDSVKTIIIQKGITRIGNYALWARTAVNKVIIPDSLKEVGVRAFQHVGAFTEPCYTEWVNLDITKLKCEENSFVWAAGLESYKGAAAVMITPTPTPTPTAIPTPTPTPLPDANHPRRVLSKKMGEDIVFEFWDNGYLYIKGTGKTYDQKESYHWDEARNSSGSLPKEFLQTLKHLVVEEGVTYLGRSVFNDLPTFETAELPESLTEIHSEDMGSAKFITGYYEGKLCTLDIRQGKYPAMGLQYIFDAGDSSIMEKYDIIVKWK